jgi:hypothetical protein
VKGKKGEEEDKIKSSFVRIDLDSKTQLQSDSYQWVLIRGAEHLYFRRLEQAIQAYFDIKVRTSRATTIQELADAVIRVRMEILDTLAPFCEWSGGNIHFLIGEDFKTKVGRQFPDVAGTQ